MKKSLSRKRYLLARFLKEPHLELPFISCHQVNIYFSGILERVLITTSLDHKYYEVICPENANPGDTINVVVYPKGLGVSSEPVDEDKSPSAFDKARQRVYDFAIEVDRNYHISQTASDWDKKYGISSHVYEFISPLINRAKSFDESHHITERVTTASKRFIVFAKEIDGKYAISATAGRFIEASASAIQAAVEVAVTIDNENHITERTSAAVHAAVNKVQEIDQQYEISSSAQKILAEGLAKVQEFVPKSETTPPPSEEGQDASTD